MLTITEYMFRLADNVDVPDKERENATQDTKRPTASNCDVDQQINVMKDKAQTANTITVNCDSFINYDVACALKSRFS